MNIDDAALDTPPDDASKTSQQSDYAEFDPRSTWVRRLRLVLQFAFARGREFQHVGNLVRESDAGLVVPKRIYAYNLALEHNVHPVSDII